MTMKTLPKEAACFIALLIAGCSWGNGGPSMPEVVENSPFFVPGKVFASDPAEFDGCTLDKSNSFFDCSKSEGNLRWRGHVDAANKKVFAGKANLSESLVRELTPSKIRQMAENKWGKPTSLGEGFFPQDEFSAEFALLNRVCNVSAKYYVWDDSEATIVLEDCTRPSVSMLTGGREEWERTVAFTYLRKADAPDGYKAFKIDTHDL
jgi:hypothetical protein